MVIVGTKEVPTRAKWTLLVRDGGVGQLKRSEGLRKSASKETPRAVGAEVRGERQSDFLVAEAVSRRAAGKQHLDRPASGDSLERPSRKSSKPPQHVWPGASRNSEDRELPKGNLWIAGSVDLAVLRTALECLRG
jgi:hypothetical protein